VTNNERAKSIIEQSRCEAAGLILPVPLPQNPAALPQPPADQGDQDRRSYWEAVFASPDPWNYGSVYEQVKYTQTLALIPAGCGRRALEIACAEGVFTAMLAPRVDQLLAVDISEQALERAAGRCRGRHNIEFRQLDLVSDPVPDNLDLIVCSEVLYYLEDETQLAAVAVKLRNALKPGGRIVTAHAYVLSDAPGRTAFDWDNPFGITTIMRIFAETGGLSLERAIDTGLYRICAFRLTDNDEAAPQPLLETAAYGTPLEDAVAQYIIWDGAVVRRADAWQNELTHDVPVLMYHRIASAGPAALARYRTSPQAFDAQMRLLRRHGYYAITSATFCEHLKTRKPFRGRPVMITFDDGYEDFASAAFPILKRYDMSAEVFIVTDNVGGSADWDAEYGPPAALMNWQQIQQLQQAGIAFGSHSAIHCSADSLSSGDLLRAAARSKAILEIRLGRAVSSIALPYGIYDARSETVLKLCDYQIAYTTQERRATLNDRPLRIPRIEVRGDVELDEFAAAVGIFPGTGSHAEAIRPGPDRLLVSVIIPAYNAAYTIAETLQSVCWQTYANLEIIVVDDGSGDETVAIVRQHAASDARIRLLQQDNAGVAAARNAGIAAAQADYIALLDADDLWHSSKIERQMAVLLARGATVALVYTWYALIDDSGTIIGHSPQSLD
jgi:peptidoglycan/xylan/chitin deacetylase (PgdA/CDA1 family)/protein-L-isoaspartate O-methyltransferase